MVLLEEMARPHGSEAYRHLSSYHHHPIVSSKSIEDMIRYTYVFVISGGGNGNSGAKSDTSHSSIDFRTTPLILFGILIDHQTTGTDYCSA
jgi:hypothetical protein